eukprot:5783339-Amphidinium_carterae.1
MPRLCAQSVFAPDAFPYYTENIRCPSLCGPPRKGCRAMTLKGVVVELALQPHWNSKTLLNHGTSTSVYSHMLRRFP